MITNSESAAIHLEGISKRFGRNTALDNLSLGVPPGTVFALLGENGAGKTTAIRILLGLCDPDDGTALDLEMEQPDRRRRHPPQRRVCPGGIRPVRLDDRPRNRPFRRRVPCGDVLERLSDGSSTISTSRAIARSAPSPRGCGRRSRLPWHWRTIRNVLILDEPTSGLDAIVRREFLESMVDRAAAGKTVFLSSHQINEVERVADYVAIIKKSTLLTVEKLDALKNDVHSVTLALADDSSDPPALPGTVLESRVRGRQLSAIVRHAEEERAARIEEIIRSANTLNCTSRTSRRSSWRTWTRPKW